MIGTASSFLAKLGCLPLVPDVMTTSMTLFCQLLALGRAPNKDRDRSIRSQLNSRCQLVSLPSLFIAIYIAKTKALLPTVWPVPNVSYNTVNLTTGGYIQHRTR